MWEKATTCLFPTGRVESKEAEAFDRAVTACLFPTRRAVASESTEAEAVDPPVRRSPPVVTEGAPPRDEDDEREGRDCMRCCVVVVAIAVMLTGLGIGLGANGMSSSFLFLGHYVLFLFLYVCHAMLHACRADAAANAMVSRDGQRAMARVTKRYHWEGREDNKQVDKYAVDFQFGALDLLVVHHGFPTQRLWRRETIPVKYLLFWNDDTDTYGLCLVYAPAAPRNSPRVTTTSMECRPNNNHVVTSSSTQQPHRGGSPSVSAFKLFVRYVRDYVLALVVGIMGIIYIVNTIAGYCMLLILLMVTLVLHFVAAREVYRLAPAFIAQGTYPEAASDMERGFLCANIFIAATVFLWKIFVFTYFSWWAPAGKRFAYFDIFKKHTSITRVGLWAEENPAEQSGGV